MIEPQARSRQAAARTRDIAGAALVAFTQGGYRLTQIAHVAELLGVSVGSIYRYVESKEALFHIAALASLDQLPDDPALPIKVAGLHETVATITELIARDPLWPALRGVISRLPAGDAGAEARAVAAELYDTLAARAAFLSLLGRCEQDIPELTDLFDQRVRRRLISDLVTWVLRRGFATEGGRPEAEALARGAMEAVSWLAKTRPHDRTAANIADAPARAAAVRIFANAFN